MEYHSIDRNRGLELGQEVPCNGFPFPILIACKYKLVYFLQIFLQFIENLFLAFHYGVVKGETMVYVDTIHIAFPTVGIGIKVHHMSLGGFYYT